MNTPKSHPLQDLVLLSSAAPSPATCIQLRALSGCRESEATRAVWLRLDLLCTKPIAAVRVHITLAWCTPIHCRRPCTHHINMYTLVDVIWMHSTPRLDSLSRPAHQSSPIRAMGWMASRCTTAGRSCLARSSPMSASPTSPVASPASVGCSISSSQRTLDLHTMWLSVHWCVCTYQCMQHDLLPVIIYRCIMSHIISLGRRHRLCPPCILPIGYRGGTHTAGWCHDASPTAHGRRSVPGRL